MSTQIIERYTQSLFELADEAGKVDAVFQDLQGILRIIHMSDEFHQFISDPAFSQGERQEMLKSIFKGSVDSLTLSFIQFIDHKGRLEFLYQIIKAFEEKYLVHTNKVKAFITSSSNLSASQIAETVEHLTKKLNKEVLPMCCVDKDLIAGVKIRVGDKIYDYSIRKQLKDFKETCIHY